MLRTCLFFAFATLALGAAPAGQPTAMGCAGTAPKGESVLQSNARDAGIVKREETALSAEARAALDDRESRAKQAAARGDHRAALLEYSALAKEALPYSDRERRAVTGVLAAAGRVGAPPIPEEARHFMARGQAIFKDATVPADYADAAREMHRASQLAPWWPAAHFNLALALEGAGAWTDAADRYKTYLRAKPDAPDAADVKQKIAEMEVKAERAERPAGEPEPQVAAPPAPARRK